MLLSDETMGHRAEMLTLSHFPTEQPFQVAFFFAQTMDYNQFCQHQLTTDSTQLPAPTARQSWHITMPPNVNIGQFHGHSGIFSSNSWADDLVNCLTNCAFFDDDNCRRVIPIFAHSEDLSDTLEHNQADTVSGMLIDTMVAISETMNADVIFAGVTVSRPKIANHPAVFINHLQEALSDRRAAGQASRVHYYDAFTFNYPEAIAHSANRVKPAYAEKHFVTFILPFLAFALQNLDDLN
jgi:hypothetical protein